MVKKKNNNNYVNIPSLLIIGIGVGILIGLSNSPVLHLIVGGVMTLIGGIIGALSGIRSNLFDRFKIETVSALPLAVLVVGLVAGALSGIHINEFNMLSPSPQEFANRWSGIGLTEQERKRRLFDGMYPPQQPTQVPAEISPNKSNSFGTSQKNNTSANTSTNSGGNTDINKYIALPKYKDVWVLSNPYRSEKYLNSDLTIRCNIVWLVSDDRLADSLLEQFPSTEKEVKKCSKDHECLDGIRRKRCP